MQERCSSFDFADTIFPTSFWFCRSGRATRLQGSRRPRWNGQGAVAKRLCRGLQSLLGRFDSAPRLQYPTGSPVKVAHRPSARRSLQAASLANALCHCTHGSQVERLHLLSSPGRTPQEFQAGGDAGFVVKATDRYCLANAFPAETLDQFLKHALKGDAVKGIGGL